MEYGRVRSSEMQMLRKEGESLKTRDCVSDVYLKVTKARTDSVWENAEFIHDCRRNHHKLLHPSEELRKQEMPTEVISLSDTSSSSQRAFNNRDLSQHCREHYSRV